MLPRIKTVAAGVEIGGKLITVEDIVIFDSQHRLVEGLWTKILLNPVRVGKLGPDGVAQ
jgi:hypothetical protein